MRRISLVTTLCAIIVVSGIEAGAAGRLHTKLLPHSLEYPLISPRYFPNVKGDPYRASFNVRRLSRSVGEKDYTDTLLESYGWHQIYGGYGVLGNGEDVFTSRAARYRRRHQGR